MPPLIDSSSVIDDIWQAIDDDQAIGDQQAVIVGIDRLTLEWDRLTRLPIKLGVLLEADFAVEDLTPYLDRLALISLQFKVFSDGRAFSQARLLRDRYHFDGDIRAVGHVICDQLRFMKNSGFNQFQLAEGEDLDLAFRSFGDFSFSYQAPLKQSNGG